MSAKISPAILSLMLAVLSIVWVTPARALCNEWSSTVQVSMVGNDGGSIVIDTVGGNGGCGNGAGWRVTNSNVEVQRQIFSTAQAALLSGKSVALRSGCSCTDPGRQDVMGIMIKR